MGSDASWIECLKKQAAVPTYFRLLNFRTTPEYICVVLMDQMYDNLLW